MATLISAPTRAVMSSVVAAAFAALYYVSWPAAMGFLIIAVGLFAWGWPTLLALPTRAGLRVLLIAVTAAAFGVVFATGDLSYLTLVTAGAIIGAFGRELLRRDGRPRLVESLSASMSGIAVIVSAAGWAAIGEGQIQVAVVLTAAVTLAAGSTISALHLKPWPHAIVAIAFSVGLGVVGGQILPGIDTLVGGLIGACTGLLSAALHVLLGRYPSAGRPWAAISAALLPLVVIGVPVYVLLRFYLI